MYEITTNESDNNELKNTNINTQVEIMSNKHVINIKYLFSNSNIIQMSCKRYETFFRKYYEYNDFFPFKSHILVFCGFFLKIFIKNKVAGHVFKALSY